MSKYLVSFDRIGRSGPRQFQCSADTGSDLCDQIGRFAKKHLLSREFDVLVDLETGKGSLEFGRFGTFRIEPQP